MFEWIADPNAWLALGTLTILEIVLGIDNIIFLSLVVAKLPKAQQNKARRIGLSAAMIMRLLRCISISASLHSSCSKNHFCFWPIQTGLVSQRTKRLGNL